MKAQTQLETILGILAVLGLYYLWSQNQSANNPLNTATTNQFTVPSTEDAISTGTPTTLDSNGNSVATTSQNITPQDAAQTLTNWGE